MMPAKHSFPKLVPVPMAKSLLPHERKVCEIFPAAIIKSRRLVAVVDPSRLPSEIWHDGDISGNINVGGHPALAWGAELVLTANGPRLGVYFEYVEPWWKRALKRLGLR